MFDLFKPRVVCASMSTMVVTGGKMQRFIQFSPKRVNMSTFYNVSCCAYHGSVGMRSPVSDAKSLMLTLGSDVAATLNTTLNLPDRVSKSKREIQTHFLEQPWHFICLLQAFELCCGDSSFTALLHLECDAVPDERSS